MWMYDKKLEYPILIKNPNPALAKLIVTQYGGPDGELGAAVRYLSQRFSMLTPQARATLNDIGTEEIGHLLVSGGTPHEVRELAMSQGMRTMGQEAMAAVAADITTIDEVIRNVYLS